MTEALDPEFEILLKLAEGLYDEARRDDLDRDGGILRILNTLISVRSDAQQKMIDLVEKRLLATFPALAHVK